MANDDVVVVVSALFVLESAKNYEINRSECKTDKKNDENDDTPYDPSTEL